MDITANLTRQFWRDIRDFYGTRVVPKANAWEMRLSGRVLGWLGIMSYETFMSRYTTVWGRRIYPWFQIGQGDARQLWYQIVVCVHEHQHVVQYDRDGFLRVAARYVLSSRRRALLEAEAYRCNLEMHWWRHRHCPEPAMLAARLSQYGCNQSDVAAARLYLEEALYEVREDFVRNEASLWAIDWLERHGLASARP